MYAHGSRARIVVIQDRVIVFFLIFKNSRFQPRIFFKSAVTLDMIERYVKTDRKSGREFIRTFKLKAGYLEHRDCTRQAVRPRRERNTDIA